LLVLFSRNRKKVGIPQALIYYKFSELWKTFFSELGAEVIISPKTTKKILEAAVSLAPDEDCYSTKLYFGHVMSIKNKVDYLFIPRFGSAHKTNSGCPKFIGLADVLRSMFPELPEIIMPYFSKAKAKHGKRRFIRIAFEVGLKFTRNPIKIVKATLRSVKAYKEHLQKLVINEETLHKWEQSEIYLNDSPIITSLEKPLKVALVGHSYVINDPFASFNIRNKLQKYGIDIITSEQMPRKLIEEQMGKLEYNLYFDYTREILGTIMHFLESKTIDGIIQLIVFSCGPDSITGEMAAIFSKQNPQVPLLQLVFDELTAEAGIKTRIEAFIDMIIRRRQKQKIIMTVSHTQKKEVR